MTTRSAQPTMATASAVIIEEIKFLDIQELAILWKKAKLQSPSSPHFPLPFWLQLPFYL